MPRRYVIQRHTTVPRPVEPGPGDVHYDLMIEAGATLVTVQLEAPPSRPVAGARSFDHRLRYLDYEGELTRGRGWVEIWDRGQLDDLVGDPRAPLYRARLQGERLRGVFELREEAAGAVAWGPAARG